MSQQSNIYRSNQGNAGFMQTGSRMVSSRYTFSHLVQEESANPSKETSSSHDFPTRTSPDSP